MAPQKLQWVGGNWKHGKFYPRHWELFCWPPPISSSFLTKFIWLSCANLHNLKCYYEGGEVDLLLFCLYKTSPRSGVQNYLSRMKFFMWNNLCSGLVIWLHTVCQILNLFFFFKKIVNSSCVHITILCPDKPQDDLIHWDGFIQITNKMAGLLATTWLHFSLV